MTNKHGGIPLEQRVRVGHATVNRPPTHPPAPGPNYGETATHYDPSSGPQHVWVTTEVGRNPGLLVSWRKPDQLTWEALVVHCRPHQGRWATVREWVMAIRVDRLRRPLVALVQDDRSLSLERVTVLGVGSERHAEPWS